MMRKAITRRQKQVDHVVAYVRTYAEKAAKILNAQAKTWDLPEPVPDLLTAQRVLARWLDLALENLQRKEAEYQRKVHEGPELRTRRGELTRELYDKIVALRGFLERVYGKPAALRVTGLRGRTPRDPFELAKAGRTLVDRLRAEGGELPEPRFAGLEFRPEVTAEDLEPLARELTNVLRRLRTWDRETDLLLLARNEARTDLDELVVGIQEMMDGFYVAAGLRHLVPGLRTPGSSMKRALREAPESSRRRARLDLAEAEG